MSRTFALTVVLLGAFAALCSAYRNDDIIREVNSKSGNTWVAGHNHIFDGMTLNQIRRLMGTKLPAKKAQVRKFDGKVPTSFDARTAWPNCSTIGLIRDQKCCGSCWAFGAVESFEDRYCIASGRSILLSAQALVACDSSDNGCQGGEPSNAWQFFVSNGIPTESCQPYTPTGGAEPCTDFQPTPQCQTSCSGTSSDYTLYKAKSVYSPGCSLFSCDAGQMAADVAQNGPIELAFTVYEDFLNYKSGVYKHVSGSALGGHAVKAVGFGVENGTPYWLIANSWSTKWGDGGYFKIARGTDESGIEDGATAGYAQV